MTRLSLTALLAPLALVTGNLRRRPGRWLWPAFGVAVAVTFTGAVAVEAVVAADQAARVTLRDLSPLDRAVRITWQGPSTSSASGRATTTLRGLGLGGQAEVTLLNPVRLDGQVVRPVAIAPLGRWVRGGGGGPGPCRPRRCPMLVSGGAAPQILSAPGVRIALVAATTLRSDVPLGFAPQDGDSWPLVLSGDPHGLDRLPGLSGVYRVHSWVAELATTSLHSWQLPDLERRLARAQAALLGGSTQFGMSAPFDGLDFARAEASAAPRSLLLAAGSASAALLFFVLLAAAGLRREQLEDLARLRRSGAIASQLCLFIAVEALMLSGVALLLGSLGALGAGSAVAALAGEPIGPVLAHSLTTPAAGFVLLGGWLVVAGLIVTASHLRSAAVVTLAAVAAAAGLVAELVLGVGQSDRSVFLIVPGCCVAAGAVVFRLTLWLVPFVERFTRRTSSSIRLALLGLARRPGPPAAAITFTCVAVGLGGFALAYRATLEKGAADQAADRVPLDATVSAGPSFATPLELGPLSDWRSISDGQVFPVRRTQATYQVGESTETVPALGVPARALTLIHGWRSSDGSASLRVLARRLLAHGPVRAPGPTLTAGARRLSLAVRSPDMAIGVAAELRDSAGDIRPLALGTATRLRGTLSARLPAGRWEIEALELMEGTGVEITSGHQNGENAAPATQFTAHVDLGPLMLRGKRGRLLGRFGIGRWIGVGAATTAGSLRGGGAQVRFQASGMPGVLRPRQPTDSAAVPVLCDPATAAAAGTGGRLALSVDDQPVRARVVGVLRRFPTLSGAGSFVVADEGVLAAALDAQLPGQGRPDELWIAGARRGPLRAALRRGPLAQLRAAFRADIERQLDRAPIARAVVGTLLAAAGVSGGLALVGLLLIVRGPFRDRWLEEDLAAQGVGPSDLREVLQTKLVLAGGFGVAAGVVLAILLVRLAVAAAGSLGAGGPPIPPLVTILPAGALGGWAVGGLAVVLIAAALAPRGLICDGRDRPHRRRPGGTFSEDVRREEWAR